MSLFPSFAGDAGAMAIVLKTVLLTGGHEAFPFYVSDRRTPADDLSDAETGHGPPRSLGTWCCSVSNANCSGDMNL
ncbi:hypothetical protein [Syntrophobacter fumaroxidans]|uniref:hypothetical protein n=1 Tax=Syntrophobacter fumaroxidans TaxID=119484 RepID=UPI0002D342F3|nr:hypothetical protein [Syntrophobacter fumaroxidans]